MIEVVKEGNSEKRAICPQCNAELKYMGIDIQEECPIFTMPIKIKYIVCPECGNKIIIDMIENPKTFPRKNIIKIRKI